MKNKNSNIKQKRTFFIAELGVNHEGDLNVCKSMISEAKKAGADAVKIQTFDPAEHYLPDTDSYNIFKNCMFNNEEIAELFLFAKEIDIKLFSTCGDHKTIDFIDSFNPFAFKISSGVSNHLKLINYVAKKKRNVLISTGMSDFKEINMLVSYLKKIKCISRTTLMHCVSIYPTVPQFCNIQFIKTLYDTFKIPIGFSDHSLGYKAVEVAVSLGSRMIEKHFTLDKKRNGFDHKISLEPHEFMKMVESIREIEKILGNGEKLLTKKMIHKIDKMKRVIVAKEKIARGDRISSKNITLMRVKNNQKGINPMFIDNIIGRTIIQKLAKHQILKMSYLKD